MTSSGELRRQDRPLPALVLVFVVLFHAVRGDNFVRLSVSRDKLQEMRVSYRGRYVMVSSDPDVHLKDGLALVRTSNGIRLVEIALRHGLVEDCLVTSSPRSVGRFLEDFRRSEGDRKQSSNSKPLSTISDVYTGRRNISSLVASSRPGRTPVDVVGTRSLVEGQQLYSRLDSLRDLKLVHSSLRQYLRIGRQMEACRTFHESVVDRMGLPVSAFPPVDPFWNTRAMDGNVARICCSEQPETIVGLHLSMSGVQASDSLRGSGTANGPVRNQKTANAPVRNTETSNYMVRNLETATYLVRNQGTATLHCQPCSGSPVNVASVIQSNYNTLQRRTPLSWRRVSHDNVGSSARESNSSRPEIPERTRDYSWQSNAPELSVPGRQTINTSQQPTARGKTKTSSRRKRSLFSGWVIFPGTKWCGDGDIADNRSDLGYHSRLDKCCRRHDRCKTIIPRLTWKYGIFNFRLHTLSHCRCDRKFRKCLQKVASPIAYLIGRIFFNVIGPQCFKFTHQSACAERNWWGSCLQWASMKMAVLRRQRRFKLKDRRFKRKRHRKKILIRDNNV